MERKKWPIKIKRQRKKTEQKTVLGSRSNSFSLSFILVGLFFIIIIINTRSLYSIACIEFDLCAHGNKMIHKRRRSESLKLFFVFHDEDYMLGSVQFHFFFDAFSENDNEKRIGRNGVSLHIRVMSLNCLKIVRCTCGT